MGKLGMVAAGAVGYVLGARAGRERYDQIVYQAQRLWTNPKVQQAAAGAQERAMEAAPIVAEKVGEAAKHAAGAAASAVSSVRGDSDSSDASRDTSAGSASNNGSNPDTQVSHL